MHTTVANLAQEQKVCVCVHVHTSVPQCPLALLMGKKRGKRGAHTSRPATKRSAAGRRNQDFNILKSALRKGDSQWLSKPENQGLIARWERHQLSEQDRDITLAGEPAVARQHNSEGEDSPESSNASP